MAHSFTILRLLLSQGASVHLRNNTGNTPLFLAASAGLLNNVNLLKQSGAHLHPEELATARLHAQSAPVVWRAAGILPAIDQPVDDLQGIDGGGGSGAPSGLSVSL